MAFRWRWLLVLFALILSGEQLSAASTKEQRAYAAAVAAFKNEMWGRAETEFAQFVQKYPRSTNTPEAVLLQAQAEFKQGNLAQAIALLNARKAGAGHLADQYVYWIGEAQFQNGDFTNAAETWIALEQKFPESESRLRAVVEAAAAYTQLTNWWRHDALLENTNGVFQRAAQLDPGNELVVDGWLSLENSKYQQGDFPGVAAVYELLANQRQTLNQGQQFQGAYLYYLAKMEQGDFAAALAASTNLAQIAGSPMNQEWLATAWASQGAALEQMDRLPEAIQTWQKNLTNAPVAQKREAILKIAELEIVQGQLTNAEQSLTNFLAQFPETISADIALLTAGELRLKDYAAQPAATNQLQEAQAYFNRFLAAFPNSPLVGKAYLDRGWCEWLAENMTNSLADFEEAVKLPLSSRDLAVARFKLGDALFRQGDFTNALKNYRAVVDEFTQFPAIIQSLGNRALYQSLRASMALTNTAAAEDTMGRILKLYPFSEETGTNLLLMGEYLADLGQPTNALAMFQKFEAVFPHSLLRPRVELAIAHTCELETNWPVAIEKYKNWLADFPTNALRPQADYALARANYKGGIETNAFLLFTNFVAKFPTNDLTPLAQWWLADHFFNAGLYPDAEKNYKLLFQKWPASDLAYQARMMAGVAAVARQGYSDALEYFYNLETDTNCDMNLRVQATSAHGAALMLMDSTDTNNPLANFQRATNDFIQICLLYPANESGALAWIEIGKCNLQLTNYDAATNAYAQVVNSPSASIAARSQAQIGIGIALEKMAALATGMDQTNLLQMALDNYLKVFDTWTGNNLRAGESADPFWVKEAGLQALPLVQMLGAGDPDKFINQMEELFPQSKDSLEKKRSTLPAAKS